MGSIEVVRSGWMGTCCWRRGKDGSGRLELALTEKEDVDPFLRGEELGVGLDPGRHRCTCWSKRRARLEAETWSPWRQVCGKPETGRGHLGIEGR